MLIAPLHPGPGPARRGRLAGPALGAPAPILNPGFETDAFASGTFNVVAPTGWDVWDPDGALEQGQTAVGLALSLRGRRPRGGLAGPRAVPVS